MTDQLHLWPEDQPGDRFKWSISRDKRLRDCARKYYLQHYASRGGWNANAAPEVRALHILKHLQNRFMWVGGVVHSMIELALAGWRRGEDVPVTALVERGTRRMRAQYAESIQGVYRQRPAAACGLVEHEYTEDVSRDEWKNMRDRMERCLRTFFDLSLTRTIRETPPWRWLALESMGSFDIDGATVLVKPDFAWRNTDDEVVMVDWKTGKPRDQEEWLQLAVYGLYARRAWGLGTDHLLGHVAYLETGTIRNVRIEEDDLSRAEESIRASLAEMRRLNADAVDNMPDAERFPLTDDVSRCTYCNYRRVCDRMA